MISPPLTVNPNAAIIGLTLGIALIALELNRPGLILPGACGLLLSLLSAAAIIHHRPSPWAAALLLIALAAMLLQLRLAIPLWASALDVIALIAAFEWLFPPYATSRVDSTTASLCGITLGTGITVLTRIAHRARRNKGLD